jgi:glycine C-acetyltransferase
MTTRNPTAFLKEEYQELVKQSIDWRPRVLQSASQPHAKYDGKEVLMFCSNNYLGLTTHPKMKKAMIEATEKYGTGSGSVRPIAGNMELHIQLEKRIAKFKGVESALAYMSGFATNQGLTPTLAGPGDIIISDELNHGSIIDGVRLTKAERGIYKHTDMGDLEKVLKEADKKYKKICLITDGVFSMDGDIAPLDKIVPLAEEFGAMVYVDDAHGEGVLGKDYSGKGAVDHFQMQGRVHIEMGTFSKAFGVVGGFAAGIEDLRNYALNKSRSWLLSGTHSPGTVAACIAALDVVDTEKQHVKNLWENTRYFKKELQSLGFDIGRSVTPITPAMCGESAKAQELSKKLWDQGVYALPIVFPMVARDKARIRNMIMASMTKDDLNKALAAYEKAGKALKII